MYAGCKNERAVDDYGRHSLAGEGVGQGRGANGSAPDCQRAKF
jgi:hypothetical protein